MGRLVTRRRIGISSVPGWELNWVFIKYVGLTRPKKRYGSVHKHQENIIKTTLEQYQRYINWKI